MGFIETVRDSIYSPQFYKEILQRSFGKALGYFLLLVLLLTLLQTIFSAPFLLTTFQAEVQKMIETGVNKYPADLTVTIKKGQVSTNVQEPYFLAVPEDDNNDRKMEDINNLIVIDTKTPFSISQFDQYKTAAWVTKDSVFYRSGANNSEVKVFALNQIDDLTINKEQVQMWAEKITPWVRYLGPTLLVLAFIGLYVIYMFRLSYLLFLSLVVWVLSKMFKSNITFGQAYKMNLYAVTLALLVELAVDRTTLWTGFHGFPFMFTIITLVVLFVNSAFQAQTSKVTKKSK